MRVQVPTLPRRRRIPRLAASIIIAAMLVAGSSQSAPTQSALADPVFPLAPPLASGDHLGMCYANYQLRTGVFVTPLAAAAGARWNRVDFAWDRIQPSHPSQGDFFFDAYDDLVTRDVENGLGTVGILQRTPDWAANCNAASAAAARVSGVADPPFLPLSPTYLPPLAKCPPKNLYLAWDHPDNHWAQFVRATVRQYRDDVKVWEIWNEPDLWDFFWTGSVADYAQLLKVGYQVIKAEDPEATVLFAGLAYWANPSYYVAVLDELAAMPDAGLHNNYYFDVMSLHLYSSIYTIKPVAASIQKAMTDRVGPHPIWLTETGVPLWDEAPADPNNRLNRASAEEAAAYAIEAFAEARAAGVERFFFFRTHDDGMGDGPFGLIRDDGTLRPAYVAYQVAATYLHGENQVTRPSLTSEGIQRITFWGTPRGRIDVLWNVTGTAVDYDYPALLPEITVIDKRGVSTPRTNTTGTVPLRLEAATANTGDGGSFLIGGDPLLVLHADTVPPTSQLHALPATWYGHALTLTWDVADDAGAGRPGTGHWYTQIELAPTPSGPWMPAAGWPETQHRTQVVIPVPGAGTWYLRARARDGAGNWEAWPATPETQTTVFVTRAIELAVDTYLDANSNGAQDPGEGAAPSTTLVWSAADGTLVSQHAGANWTTTQAVKEGDYVITARAPDSLPAYHPFTVTAGPEQQPITLSLGLKPIRARIYLPLLRK